MASPAFASAGNTVRSVDVLPVDVQIWTNTKHKEPPQTVHDRFTAVARGALSAELARHGYMVSAHLTHAGDYLNGRGYPTYAMAPEELRRTMRSLSGYGHAVASAKQGLLTPYLPHRLGEATGADATLYVGGWAYVGRDNRTSAGEKVAKGVLIALLVVAVVVVVVAVARKGGGGSAGKAVGGAAKGAAKGAARVASSAGKVGARAVAQMAKSAGRVTGKVVRGIGRNMNMRMPDSFGRTHTHIEFHSGRPDYYREDKTPKKGRSAMLLEMTLVDNRTGRVLWHVREQLPANAARPKQVQEAMRRMMAALPRGA